MHELDQKVVAHGVSERHVNKDALDEKVEEIRMRGYALLESGMQEGELQSVRQSLGKVYERQVAEAGGEEALARCNDRDVARCPLAYDKVFLDIAVNPGLMEITKRLLGSNFILLQQNGLINRPESKHYQSHWHRDLSYQHWVASEPLALNALFCVDPFTFETGATYILPGSHRYEQFPSEAFVRRNQQVMEAPAGTFLLLDAMLFHRAGINISKHPRRAVNHLIGRPFMAQQVNLPGMLGDAYRKDDFLARYLGYKWAPAPDVMQWRRQRMT